MNDNDPLIGANSASSYEAEIEAKQFLGLDHNPIPFLTGYKYDDDEMTLLYNSDLSDVQHSVELSIGPMWASIEGENTYNDTTMGTNSASSFEAEKSQESHSEDLLLSIENPILEYITNNDTTELFSILERFFPTLEHDGKILELSNVQEENGYSMNFLDNQQTSCMLSSGPMWSSDEVKAADIETDTQNEIQIFDEIHSSQVGKDSMMVGFNQSFESQNFAATSISKNFGSKAALYNSEMVKNN